MIKQVKVWSKYRKGTKRNGKLVNRDVRIYVHTDDGREGCKYLTGNAWNAKGSITGKLTEEEWTEARKIAVWDGCWHTVYENQVADRYRRFDDEDVRNDIEELRQPRQPQTIDQGYMKMEDSGTV